MEKTHHENMMNKLISQGVHDEVLNFYHFCIEYLCKNNLTVLDLGAGSGVVSSSLAKKENIGKIYAYDINDDSMRLLKEHPKIIKVTKKCDYNEEQLPFEDDFFDVVICRYAFHHIKNKVESVSEIYRVLKKGGILLYSDVVLSDHSKDILNPLYFLREWHFHGYLTYYETIDMLFTSGFKSFCSRPYKIKYDSFDNYLKGVDNGFKEKPSDELLRIIKEKIIQAWENLDIKTKQDMGIDPNDLSKGFSYHVVDIALIKE